MVGRCVASCVVYVRELHIEDMSVWQIFMPGFVSFVVDREWHPGTLAVRVLMDASFLITMSTYHFLVCNQMRSHRYAIVKALFGAPFA